jgi:hypothetical protein
MSRFTMALAAAAASAVAAIAVVALPAVGADPNTSGQQDQAPDVSAFAACLHSHGLADAPTDPEKLKPWLGAKEASDPDAVKAAAAACDDKQPAGRLELEGGPDIKDVVNCVRSHGLDAPTAPDAFKRWVAGKEASDPAVDDVMRACKMALAPKPADGPGKPGACRNDVAPADDAAKRDARPADDAAKSGI